MFTLPNLPYPKGALEPYIDATTMEIHHGKHHATYVKNLNDLVADKDEKDLEEPLKTTDNQKIKNNGGGHYNHSLFWQMMIPGGSPLEGKLLEVVNSTFGNLDGFKEKFTASALGRFGSGWVWLTTNDQKQLAIVDTPNQDSPIMTGQEVILGLDVWEHAYYLKYQNRWDFVSERFSSSPH